MAIIVSCDICGNDTPYSTWQTDPGIQMLIPNVMIGETAESNADAQDYTVCSWKCVLELATEMADPNELAEAIDDQVEIDGQVTGTHLHHGETQEEADEEQEQINRGRRSRLQPMVDPGIHIDFDPTQPTLADYLAQGGGPAGAQTPQVVRRR